MCEIIIFELQEEICVVLLILERAQRETMTGMDLLTSVRILLES